MFFSLERISWEINCIPCMITLPEQSWWQPPCNRLWPVVWRGTQNRRKTAKTAKNAAKNVGEKRKTQTNRYLAAYHSRLYPFHDFVFWKTSNSQYIYQCAGCQELKNGNNKYTPITVHGRHPNPFAHFCEDPDLIDHVCIDVGRCLKLMFSHTSRIASHEFF